MKLVCAFLYINIKLTFCFYQNVNIYDAIVKPLGEQIVNGVKNIYNEELIHSFRKENFLQKFLDISEEYLDEKTIGTNYEENEIFSLNKRESIRDSIKRGEAARSEEFYPVMPVPPLGSAVGRVLITHLENEFLSFMGIPYAKAKERFEMPELYEEEWPANFRGGYDATFMRNKCPQLSLAFPTPAGTEDCLYLNVYTPYNMEESKKKYAVMVFIHGGAFITGDTSLYIPSRLMEEDVIVVTIQYRLGVFGFLHSGTTSAPGNMGLMDQIMALRWIKKYIKHFNGDENNITLFGQSAGAASTSLLQFSPQTTAEYNNGQQLMDRIITQSGSGIEVWSQYSDYETALKLYGEATGCYDDSYTANDIVECMKQVPTSELVEATYAVLAYEFNNGIMGNLGIVPIVQEDLYYSLNDSADIKKYIVLPKQPKQMLEDDEYLHVNVMTGDVRDGGAFILSYAYIMALEPKNLTASEEFLKHKYLEFIVRTLGKEDDTGVISSSLRLAYLKEVDMSNFTDMTPGSVDLCGMAFFKAGEWKLARLLSEKNHANDVFFYSYEFESDDSLFDFLFLLYPDIPIEGGVSHTDDLFNIFALTSFLDDREKETVTKITRLWSNFAHFGDPTPKDHMDLWVDLTEKWIPYDNLNEHFLLIKNKISVSKDYPLRWNYNYMKQQNSKP